jgi:hypothetical protein
MRGGSSAYSPRGGGGGRGSSGRGDESMPGGNSAYGPLGGGRGGGGGRGVIPPPPARWRGDPAPVPEVSAWAIRRNHAPQAAPQPAPQPGGIAAPPPRRGGEPTPVPNAWARPRAPAPQQSSSRRNLQRQQQARPTRGERPRVQYIKPAVMLRNNNTRAPEQHVAEHPSNVNFYRSIIDRLEARNYDDGNSDEVPHEDDGNSDEVPHEDYGNSDEDNIIFEDFYVNFVYHLFTMMSIAVVSWEDADHAQHQEETARQCIDFFQTVECKVQQEPDPAELTRLINVLHVHLPFESNIEARAKKVLHVIKAENYKKFDPDSDGLGIMAISLVYHHTTITFVTRDKDQIVYGFDGPDEEVMMFGYNEDGNLYTSNDPFASESTVKNATWIAVPSNVTPWSSWEQPTTAHPEPSDAAIAFLHSKFEYYLYLLNTDLIKANNDKITLTPADFYKQVYQAYKRVFGTMLGECRQFFATGTKFSRLQSWMKQQLGAEVTKTQWKNVLGESIALWHAVVVVFREVYNHHDLKNDIYQEIGLKIFEHKNKRSGEPHPEHHVSNLVIQVQLANSTYVTVSNAWSTYSKKLFAKNTEKFVLAYQKLLMAHYDMGNTNIAVFGFWFYLSDLAAWIRDVRELLADPGARAYPKRFNWPKCCRKGEPLDEDPTTCFAYQDFCKQMRLSFHAKSSQQQFRVRMRAAWLRLVACYPYATGTTDPTPLEIQKYLAEQHIREVDVRSGETVEPTDLPTIGNFYNSSEADRQRLRDRRILVPGAHMTNPYLCTP